jgi:hypothetical protein
MTKPTYDRDWRRVLKVTGGRMAWLYRARNSFLSGQGRSNDKPRPVLDRLAMRPSRRLYSTRSAP